MHLLLCVHKQSSELAPCPKPSNAWHKASPAGFLTPCPGLQPQAELRALHHDLPLHFLLPLWVHHLQMLHLLQQDLAQPWGSRSLTLCYPLVLDQAGYRLFPSKSRLQQVILFAPGHPKFNS